MSTNPTIRQFLNQAGIDPEIILVHVETCNSPSHGRPRDQSRYLGFDQHVYADVLQDCQNMFDFGVCPMFNTYKVGSPESQSLMLYLKAMAATGLFYMINVDKEVWQNTPSADQAIRDYIAWLRVNCFSQPNYITHGGKFVLTFFVQGNEDPAMFAAIENDAANQDIAFVYNDPRIGRNTMWWVTQSLVGGITGWCAVAARRGGLQIPGIAHGFNDTYNGQCVWGGPARVWGPPSLQVLTAMRDMAANYYGAANQPRFFQFVTWNDCDEGTNLSPRKDGSGSYFAARPSPSAARPVLGPTVVRQEVWVNGRKVGNWPPGSPVAVTDGAVVVLDGKQIGTCKPSSQASIVVTATALVDGVVVASCQADSVLRVVPQTSVTVAGSPAASFPRGSYIMTVQQVYSDGSLKKDITTFDV